jgi:hypothetical protein
MTEYLQAIAAVLVLRRSCQSAAIDEVAKRLCESISNASKGGKTVRFTCHTNTKGGPSPSLPSDGARFTSTRSLSLSCAPASSVPADWRLGRAGAPGPSDT